MDINLFGEKVVKEESIEILYSGPSFENRMEIRDLHVQLEAIDKIVKDTVNALKKNKKIDLGSDDIKIFLKLKKGSFGEIIEIVFNSPIFQGIVVGCIIATYNYFLTNRNNKSRKFTNEIEDFEKDKNFKSNMKKVVLPINVDGDQVNIIGDNNKVVINQNQKEDFLNSLEEEPTDELLKNGEFEEELFGVIRKLDLDAQNNNYFGFNIKDGALRIPTSVMGEFNLNIYRNLINEPVKVRAAVRYKDGIITHIKIMKYEIINKSKQNRLFDKSDNL